MHYTMIYVGGLTFSLMFYPREMRILPIVGAILALLLATVLNAVEPGSFDAESAFYTGTLGGWWACILFGTVELFIKIMLSFTNKI